MKKLLATCIIGLVAMNGAAFSAEEALPADQIRQGEAKQQQIKTQTQLVADQLGLIIDEFKRNGLDGDDVRVLGAIQQVLGKLSEREMQRVIDLLQTARSTSDPGQSERHLAGAVSDQKNIVAQMRQLLLEYQRQQALYELSLRLAWLAERQHGNLKVTVEQAKATQGRTGSRFDDNRQASLQVQQAEQTAIRDEANPLIDKLASIAKESDGPTQERLNTAIKLSREHGLQPAMESAISDLKAANLFRAASNEKTVRDELRELSRRVAPPKDALATLRQAASDLDKAIDQQKKLIDDTKTADKQRNKDREKAAAELESRQGDIVDKTDQARKDIEAAAPEAAKGMKDAMDTMQDARADLNEKNMDKATKDETGALNKLEAAKNAVQEAIAKAEPPKQYDDSLAAAKELQERTRELIKKEEDLKANTKANENKRDQLKAMANQQGDVENQTRELQKDAAAAIPDAAQPVGDAADQMDKSEQKLAKAEDPKSAQDAQTAAVASLKQADDILSKKIADLQKAQQDLAAAKDARDKVEKLIQDQQKVERDTGKAAAKADAAQQNASNDTPKAKDLAAPQGEIAKQTDQVKSDVDNLDKPAANSLSEANKEMKDAKGKLDKDDAKAANPPQKEAVTDLFKAKDALDKKIDDLEKQLGVDQPDAAALADAAAKIEQLKNDVAAAQDELANQPQAVQKSLAQQQKQIAKDLGQMKQQAPDSKPLEQAEQAADKAADQLAQNKPAEAVASMKEAQKNMQAAMKDQPEQKQLPKTSKKQADLQKLAEQLAQNKPPDPMDQAAQDLGDASQDAGDLAANDDGQLPQAAESALQEASSELSKSSANASAGKKPDAEQSAQKAQEALSKAQAALALAQAGLSGQMAQGKKPGQPKQSAQAKAQSQTPSQQPANAQQARSTGNQGTRGGNQTDGARRDEKNSNAYVGLPPRDRATILQSQNDKYPAEYGPQVEQYLRNLSDTEK